MTRYTGTLFADFADELYEPLRVPVHVPDADGALTDAEKFHAILRPDTREVLGVVGKNYQLLSNLVAFQSLEEAILRAGTKVVVKDWTPSASGALTAVLEFPEFVVPDPCGTGVSALMVLFRNGVAGDRALTLSLGMFRHVCMNMNVWGSKFIDLRSRKHTAGLHNVHQLVETQLKWCLEEGPERMTEDVNAMFQCPVSPSLLSPWFAALVEQKKLPKKFIPSTAQHDNAWEVYNHFTYVASRNDAALSTRIDHLRTIKTETMAFVRAQSRRAAQKALPA